MKKMIIKAVVTVMLLSAIAGLFTGCFLKSNIKDGPGMVNYEGLMLDAMVGGWCESDNGSYSIIFWDDYTFSLSYDYEPLLDSAELTFYNTSGNTDEYSEFEVSPNVFTDESGASVEITKASHENGTVTLELTAADGTKSTITFEREPVSDGPELLDGPDMYYAGHILDEALTGVWQSADGRLVLDFNGKYADFTVDGELLASKDGGYFVDHSFSQEDDLNERCELYPTGNYTDAYDDPPLTINEMWYEAGNIYMNVIRQDGKTEEIVFSKQQEAIAEGEMTEMPDTAESEAVPEEELPKE